MLEIDCHATFARLVFHSAVCAWKGTTPVHARFFTRETTVQVRITASNSLLTCLLVNCAAWLYCQTGMMQLGPAPSVHFFATRLLPIVLCAGGALYFGNVAYMSLSVAFIQILKVSTDPTL